MLIQGGRLVDAGGDRTGDLRVGPDGVAEVAGRIKPLEGEEVFDASGLLVVPGGVDAHTHMRLPVGEVRVSDDFGSGTAAAPVGGTTTVIDYVTAYRGEDPLASLAKWQAWTEDAAIDVGFHMTFTESVPEATVAACVERGGHLVQAVHGLPRDPPGR